MTQTPSELNLRAALRDFLVYQKASRRKNERLEFLRLCNVVLFILLGMALAVLTVYLTANLLWGLAILGGYVALLARCFPSTALQGGSLHHEMESMLSKLRVLELLKDHLQNLTLNTQDEQFPMQSYSFIEQQCHGITDGLSMSTYWLTESSKLVHVVCRLGGAEDTLEFHPWVCGEDDHRRILGAHPSWYVRVYGQPVVVG